MRVRTKGYTFLGNLAINCSIVSPSGKFLMLEVSQRGSELVDIFIAFEVKEISNENA